MRREASPKDAGFLQRFFKTGPGEYGAGDKFIGIRVPVTRKLAREFRGLPRRAVVALLQSPIHEERLLALIILVNAYQRGDDTERAEIYKLYLAQLDRVNNWDLVDSSAPYIIGPYLLNRSRKILFRLAERLREDEHDLMHKAIGWMLREIGKRDVAVLRRFLDQHAALMPRTMLRYAIEKLSERERRRYLRTGKV